MIVDALPFLGLVLVGDGECYLSASSRQRQKLIVLGCLGLAMVLDSLARKEVAVATAILNGLWCGSLSHGLDLVQVGEYYSSTL